jgi:pimeloyl-ACP methyl ester carboxylesterase
MSEHVQAAARRVPPHRAARGDGGTPGLATVALASAAVLGATALQMRADARRAEREYPPRGRFLHAGGIRLHYFEAGGAEEPAVVLLHGNAVTAEDWVASGVFNRIARHRRVVAFDRPGYGYSERPRDRLWTAEDQAAVIAEAIRRLGLGRPIVVGHSWGTLVAVALALDHAESVSGLVLCAGYHYPTLRADVVVFSPPAVPVLGDVIRYTVGPLAGRAIAPSMIRRMFAPRSVPPFFTEAVPLPIMLRPWQIKASAEDAASMTPRARAAASRYPELGRLPVHVLAGAEDRIADAGRHSVRLHQALPGSALSILPGLGHMIHYGAPNLVADAVESIAAASRPPVAGEAEPPAAGATGEDYVAAKR